jgi:phosphoglycolate phosphatase-like HAD superfamily hydrolase
MTIKMICFDFDGTVADTMPWLEENAVRLFTKYYNIDKEKARHEYRITTGLPFSQQVEIIFPGQSENKTIIETFEHEKITLIDQQELFPETLGAFESLNDSYLLAISSSTTKEIIEDYAENKGMRSFLDDIVGFKPGFEKGRHHFEYLMEKFSLTKDEIVYVGDSKKDMERAYYFGIRFIARLGPMFTSNDFTVSDNGIIISFPCITSLMDVQDIIQSFK